MAIKASATITLTAIKDIDSVYWFYKLQASTATPPTKAKMVKPSSKGGVPTDTTGVSGSWTSSEPTYTSGDTKTLYCVELTYYTDGTSEFSEVSVSSSYEAAKQAYNKAQNAETLAVNGAKVATNYLTDITDGGISVHPMGVTSDRAVINGEGLEIFKGDVSVAKFGETVRIGVDDNAHSHQILDYHSLQLIDKEGNAYLHASDLRDAEGKYLFEGTSYTFTSGGTLDIQYLPVNALDTSYEVTVSDGSGGTITKRTSYFMFSDFPTQGATITIGPYWTRDSRAKAFTFGIRSGDVGVMSSAIGNGLTASGSYSHAEGDRCTASNNCSHAEGRQTEASGASSHAEGYLTQATARESHAEGYKTYATAAFAHAEGRFSKASNVDSHAEGYETKASGHTSHAEGNLSEASGTTSHAEGYRTLASGSYSHAEGYYPSATSAYAHAEGYYTVASGLYSHAQNRYTIASKYSQTALGKYNIEDTASGNYGQYAFIIGNGNSDETRSNALAVTWDGDVEFAVNTSATTGVDADLYSALSALGWE